MSIDTRVSDICLSSMHSVEDESRERSTDSTDRSGLVGGLPAESLRRKTDRLHP